jgi:hypothetical protein
VIAAASWVRPASRMLAAQGRGSALARSAVDGVATAVVRRRLPTHCRLGPGGVSDHELGGLASKRRTISSDGKGSTQRGNGIRLRMPLGHWSARWDATIRVMRISSSSLRCYSPRLVEQPFSRRWADLHYAGWPASDPAQFPNRHQLVAAALKRAVVSAADGSPVQHEPDTCSALIARSNLARSREDDTSNATSPHASQARSPESTGRWFSWSGHFSPREVAGPCFQSTVFLESESSA